MEEQLTITNRTSEASCLIFKAEPTKDGTHGRVEMWSMADIKPGVIVKSNQGIDFVLSEKSPERFPAREWEITEVLETRDLNGHWRLDKKKKNKQSHHTVLVIPYVPPIGDKTL